MKANLLPLRLSVWIIIILGLILLSLMVWISGWAREGTDIGAAFVTPHLPGYRFKPEILARLGEIGGGALGLGLALLVVERVLSARCRRTAALPEAERPARPAQSPARIGATVGLSLLLAGVGTIGYKWYAYVTNTTSPYDEVGIDLNSMAPGPINAWGCARLKATFSARTIPPYGCARPDGGWR